MKKDLTYEERENRIRNSTSMEVFKTNMINLYRYENGEHKSVVSIDLDRMTVLFLHEEHNGPETWYERDYEGPVTEHRGALFDTCAELGLLSTKLIYRI